MKVSIFYSWQSDIDYKTNKYFIEDSIRKAICKINKENELVACIDRDTKNRIGSPDIRDSVFDKINRCKFFICDVSMNNNGVPNSNVLIELGYAIKAVGWKRIICLFNSNTGEVEDLPFDINHNRITKYDSASKNEKNKIADIVVTNIMTLINKGELFNPIEDLVKEKIDKIFLGIFSNIINIFYFEKTSIEYVVVKDKLKKMSDIDMAYILAKTETLGFFFLYDYTNWENELKEMQKILLNSQYYSDKWCEIVICLLNWIEGWNRIFALQQEERLFKTIKNSNYIVEDECKLGVINLESSNSLNRKVLLRKEENNSYSIVRAGTIRKSNIVDKIVCLNDANGYNFTNKIKRFLEYLDNWIEESGSEIICNSNGQLFRKM